MKKFPKDTILEASLLLNKLTDNGDVTVIVEDDDSWYKLVTALKNDPTHAHLIDPRDSFPLQIYAFGVKYERRKPRQEYQTRETMLPYPDNVRRRCHPRQGLPEGAIY